MASSTGSVKEGAASTPSPTARNTGTNLFDSMNSKARSAGKPGDATQRLLGKADKTMEGRATALRLINAVARKLGRKEIQDLKKEDVAGEKLDEYFWDIGRYISTHPIPYQFKDDLSPPKEDSTRALPISTLKGYMGTSKTVVREKFPDHPYWPRSTTDNPESFNQLLSLMDPEYQRNKLIWESEGVRWGNPTCVPMPRDPIPRLLKHDPFSDDDEDMRTIGNWYSNEDAGMFDPPGPMGCDFTSVMTRRFLACSPANPSSYRAYFRDGATWNLANRGGEVGLLRWSTFHFHFSYQVLGLIRPQKKVLSSSLQCAAMNPCNPIICFRFQQGCAIGPGECLKRRFEDQGTEDMVFFDENGKKTDAIATRITNALRSGLPANCPPEIMAGTTSRSLRAGAITDMANHPHLGPLEVCARSGHKTGLNMDHYRNPMKIENTLAAAKVLAQHPSVYKPVEEPAPWWLPSKKCKVPFDALFEEWLAGCVVAPFLEGGVLRMDGERLLCIQIMWFNYIKDKFGRSSWVAWMEDLAKGAKLWDPVHTDLDSLMVLEHWSEVLRQEFWRRNECPNDLGICSFSELMQASARCESKLTKLGFAQTKDRNDTHQSLSDICRSFTAVRDELRNLRSLVSQKEEAMQNKIKAEARVYATSLSTPVSKKKRKADAPNSVEVVDVKPPAASVFNTTNNLSVTESVVHIGGNNQCGNTLEMDLPSLILPGAKKPRQMDRELRGGTSKFAPAEVDRTGKILLHQLLPKLHSEGYFGKEGNVVLPFSRPKSAPVPEECSNQPSQFHYVMELLEHATDDGQRFWLAGPFGSKHDRVYQSIVNKTKEALLVLEGSSDPAAARKAGENKPGRQQKASVNALARRIKDHKVKTRAAMPSLPPSTLGRHDTCPLIPSHEWEMQEVKLRKKATPEGNTSIRGFYSINGGSHAVRPRHLDMEGNKEVFEDGVL